MQRRIEVGTIDEDPLLGLIADGFDDMWMAMACGCDHTAGEIEKDVAIDIFDDEAFGVLDHDRRGLGTGRVERGLNGDDLGAFRPGQLVRRYCGRLFEHGLLCFHIVNDEPCPRAKRTEWNGPNNSR